MDNYLEVHIFCQNLLLFLITTRPAATRRASPPPPHSSTTRAAANSRATHLKTRHRRQAFAGRSKMSSFVAVKKAFFTFAYSLFALLALANMEISFGKIERMLNTIGFFFVLSCSAVASLLVFSLLCALIGIAKARFDARNREYYDKLYAPIARRRQEELRRWQAAYRRRLESKKQSAKTVPWTGLKHLPAPPTALEIEQKRRKHEDWERKHRLVPETPSFIPLRPLFAAPLPVQPLHHLQRPQPMPLPSAVFAPICRATITGNTITFPHLAAPSFQQVNTTDLAPTTSMPAPDNRSVAEVIPPAATPSIAAAAVDVCPRHPDGGEHATKNECAFCANEAFMMGEVPADEDPDL